MSNITYLKDIINKTYVLISPQLHTTLPLEMRV